MSKSLDGAPPPVPGPPMVPPVLRAVVNEVLSCIENGWQSNINNILSRFLREVEESLMRSLPGDGRRGRQGSGCFRLSVNSWRESF